MTGRPLCDCHGEPMVKSGAGRIRCAVAKRAASRAWYAANRERKTKYERDRYETNALQKNMNAQLSHHRRRLVELQSEGGRSG